MGQPHTPGPWYAYALDIGNDGTQDSRDLGSGLGWDISGPPAPQLRGQFAMASDAYLVAAAPDLLAIAYRVFACFYEGEEGVEDEYESIGNELEAAIKKAEGQQSSGGNAE